ncbi:MAG: hypothetical protein HY034_08770, partial [Nitrospirae bacterium]|nr:hypothetical protein [Nitrospirota bacterium]
MSFVGQSNRVAIYILVGQASRLSDSRDGCPTLEDIRSLNILLVDDSRDNRLPNPDIEMAKKRKTLMDKRFQMI